MRINYDEEFPRELASIAKFLRDFSPPAADKLQLLIEKAILQAAKRPHGGRPRGSGLRSYEIPGHPYRVIYEHPESDLINILALEDTRREPGYRRDRLK